MDPGYRFGDCFPGFATRRFHARKIFKLWPWFRQFQIRDDGAWAWFLSTDDGLVRYGAELDLTSNHIHSGDCWCCQLGEKSGSPPKNLLHRCTACSKRAPAENLPKLWKSCSDGLESLSLLRASSIFLEPATTIFTDHTLRSQDPGVCSFSTSYPTKFETDVK